MEKNSSGNTHLLLKWNQQLIKTESSKLKNSLLNISEGQSIISQRLLQNKLHNLIVNTASLENEIYDQQAIETVLKKYYVKTTESTLCKNELKIKGYIEAFIESAICSPGPISNQLLHKWQQSMFPYSRSGMFNIVSGYWRLDSLGIIPAFESMPTKKKVLLNGPKSSEIEGAMSKFIEWYNSKSVHDLFTKCALIHLYIQKIQPYEDGNTRLASMLMNRLLFQSNLSIHVIAQVNNALNTEKEVYFSWHDKMRQNGNDVTEYLIWFFNLLKNSLVHLESKKGSHKSNQRIKSEDHDLNLNQLQVLNLLHSGSLPYINLNDWSKLTDSKISVAKKHCEELISRQILSKKGEGNHAKYYVQNQSSDKFSVAAA